MISSHSQLFSIANTVLKADSRMVPFRSNSHYGFDKNHAPFFLFFFLLFCPDHKLKNWYNSSLYKLNMGGCDIMLRMVDDWHIDVWLRWVVIWSLFSDSKAISGNATALATSSFPENFTHYSFPLCHYELFALGCMINSLQMCGFLSHLIKGSLD